ncbi:ATP-grasp domain-containing protein [Stenotrophomonas oahuensis]|uniref:ATP-grasp domain-containing protein n=1 Tax=Stenotrophomonas oahuensis TaxID=3003271 RepID=A0ABY9YTL7_9GAMM|nr:ATP-grasp domain-containing protein [Stenotrophomonas sp. A5586]WNH54251.1 ATP-grasp domain-containing protein [Stenotrophomonas sp. A5586]
MPMEKVRWIVQSNLGSRRDIEAIADACQKLGLECLQVAVIPFSDALPEVPTDAPAVFYGSANFATNVHRSGRWVPGVFFDEQAFQFTHTLQQYGDECLNSDARVTTMAELAALDLADDVRLFVRPVADLKEFAGTEFSLGEYRSWYARLAGGDFDLGPDTPIIAASIKPIEHEWRLFLVHGRVVAGSHYRSHGELQVSPEIPPEVRVYAEQMAAVWSPSAVFVLDVAQSQGRLCVIEINGFNSSGFYASNIQDIVEAVSEVATHPKPSDPHFVA